MRPLIISAGLLAAFASLSFAQQPSPGPSPQPEIQPSPGSSPQPEIQPSPESVPPSPAPYKAEAPYYNPYQGLPTNPWDQAKNYWKYYFVRAQILQLYNIAH